MKKIFLTFSLLILSGCGSLMNGSTQTVQVTSNPPNAMITVDGQSYGRTPMDVLLKRKQEHIMTLTYPGYQSAVVEFRQKISGWTAGNIIFGPLVFGGLVVDALTGGVYYLTPEQVDEFLIKQKQVPTLTKKQLHIDTTTHPESDWQPVGQLGSS